MPVAPTYPGVYIQEVPSGARPITGVPTAIAAFIDSFPRGPLNRAVQVFSWGEFERIFGGLHVLSEASYGVDQFFRNGGSNAWIVRVSNSGNPAVPATAIARSATVGGGQGVTFTAAEAGEWGNNVRVRVEPAPTPTDANAFDVVAREVAIQDGRETVLREIRYAGLSMTATSQRFITDVINDAAENAGGMIRVSNVGANQPRPTGHLSAAAGGIPIAAGPKVIAVTLTGLATPDDVRQADLGDDEIATLEDAAVRLQDALRGAQPAPNFPAGRVEYTEATVRVVGTRLQVHPGVAAEPYARFTFAGGPTTGLGLQTATNSNIAAYSMGATAGSRAQSNSTAGDDGDLPVAADLIGSEGVTPPTGMFALNAVDIFNLLCLPRVSQNDTTLNTDDFPEAQVDSAISAATAYCERRRAVLLMDPSDTAVTPAGIRNYVTVHAGLRHPNVALSYPRLVIGDPRNDFRERSIGASGAIAGLCSRTDASRGVWKAPAGTEAVLRGVTRLQTKLTDAQNGILNPIAINCLRTFDLYGNVNWGARTLFGEDARGSDWKYLPVRRLALYLEETLYRSTQWVIFEPNDEPLWAQIRLAVGSFMNDLFQKGAFQGKTKQEAYFVTCDSSTTTPLDQSRGIVNLVVGFAPLKPAEFLVITIRQIPPRLEV